MRFFKRFLNLNILMLFLAFTSCTYWIYYLVEAEQKLDTTLYAKNKFENVRLNKFHSYEGIQGSWNIQHEYAQYLDKATKEISTEYGTRYFDNDSFNTNIPNVDSSKYLETSLNSKIDDDFILGLNHKFKLRINADEESKVRKYFIGRYVVLRGDNNYIAYVDSVSSEYITVIAPLKMGDIIKKIELPATNKEHINFDVLLDSERMGLARGGLVNQFIDKNNTYIYIRTFKVKDSIKLIKGRLNLTINKKNYNVKKIIPIGMQDFILEIKGDKRYQPYIDSRENIISINVSNDNFEREMSLGIENVTNDKYIFGLQRNYELKVLSDEYIKSHSRVYLQQEKQPLKLLSYHENTLKFDLLQPVVAKLKTDSNNDITYKNILNKVYNNQFSSLTNDEINTIKSIYNSIYSNSIISPFKVWLKGGNVKVYYQCNSKYKASDYVFNKKINTNLNFNIWEIYPGSMLNLFYGKSNPAPTEMMIHALGADARNQYYSDFKRIKPTYVSFAKPERFTPWLLNWHWTFFKDMIENYSPVVDLDEFSLWKRDIKDKLNSTSDVLLTKSLPYNVELGESGKEYTLYTVKVNYKIHNPYKILPLLGKSSRFFITTNSTITTLPVSIPWSESSWIFPIVVKGKQDIEFNVKKMSDFLGGSSIKIDSLYIQKENVSQDKIIDMFLDYKSMR